MWKQKVTRHRGHSLSMLYLVSWGTRGSTASLWATASPKKHQRIKHTVRAGGRKAALPSPAPENHSCKGELQDPLQKPPPGALHQLDLSLERDSQGCHSHTGTSYTEPGSALTAHREAASPRYQPGCGSTVRCPGSCAGTANKPLARTRGTGAGQAGSHQEQNGARPAAT